MKGEITGHEDLLVDGSVEGLIQLEDRKLTVGSTAKVTADVIPPPIPGDPQVSGTADRLKAEISSSLVEQYVDALKREIGVTIDRRVLQTA